MLGEVNMKTYLMAVLFSLTAVSSLAWDNGVPPTRSAKEPSKTVLITGCLVKGDEPGEVWLAQKNGKIYGLESGKIDLNAHLGQKVIVTGHVLPEGREEGTGEVQEENKAGKRETADFRVLMLKIISRSCTHGD